MNAFYFIRFMLDFLWNVRWSQAFLHHTRSTAISISDALHRVYDEGIDQTLNLQIIFDVFHYRDLLFNCQGSSSLCQPAIILLCIHQ
ncbi:MAG: hypothetical protein G01um101466_184 [Parcubacteria group bacterium Gr01-1014_66]|nr:MAG: hypothetical protein G01um101466_184 [Parcubacteria group bacterium Gr01-1014_66]